MVKEATENTQGGIMVGGQIVFTVRLADYNGTQKELQHLMDNLSRITKKYGLKIKVKKIKFTCIHIKEIIR